jgi:hypothetical protein
MIFYANNTRVDAIVTIKVSPVGDLQKGVKVNTNGAPLVQKVIVGYNDLFVPAESSIELDENVEVAFIAVRSSG